MVDRSGQVLCQVRLGVAMMDDDLMDDDRKDDEDGDGLTYRLPVRSLA